jgi:hypothetical protein
MQCKSPFGGSCVRIGGNPGRLRLAYRRSSAPGQRGVGRRRRRSRADGAPHDRRRGSTRPDRARQGGGEENSWPCGGRDRAVSRRAPPAARARRPERHPRRCGSTLRDHRQTDGSLGYFQHRFAVYDRKGAACAHARCGGSFRAPCNRAARRSTAARVRFNLRRIGSKLAPCR